MTNHLWQSTLFAVAAGILAAALRNNRAQVRYWIWFSASLKFLIPFALLMSIGGRVAPTKHIATNAVSFAIEQVAQPFPETVSFTTLMPTRDWIPAALIAAWSMGFAVIAFLRFRGWRKVRAAIRSSAPLDIEAAVEIRQSPGLLEPGVVGLLRPTLLVPEGILDRLTPHQWDAVLAHELCHVRRRDNLLASIHMAVEAVFWFHPFIWMIGGRLVEERERACDEEVLRHGGEPQVYAEAILNVCKLYVESPLVCVSGVTGADLKKRIEAIMINRLTVRLSIAKKVALVCAAIVAITVPIAIGILKAQTPTHVPKFEVASIRPCTSGDYGGRLKNRRGRAGGGSSPDRLDIVCQSVTNLIRIANGINSLGPPLIIEGAPAWADSERYKVTAKAEGTPGQETLRGPMLLALLEDRLKLKMHREIREVPVYALTVARNGFKLRPMEEAGCIPIDPAKSVPPKLIRDPGEKPYCDVVWAGRKGSNMTVDLNGKSLEELSTLLCRILDRPVINKSDISGRFVIHLEYAPDETTHTPVLLLRPGEPEQPSERSDSASGPSIFTAIQSQLGLKLESAKGPREYLVIDHVAKPTDN